MKLICYTFLVIVIGSVKADAQFKIIGLVVAHNTQVNLSRVEIREKLSGRVYYSSAKGMFEIYCKTDKVVLEFNKNGYRSWEMMLNKVKGKYFQSVKIGLLKPGEKIDVSGSLDSVKIFPFKMIPIQTIIYGKNSREMIYAIDTLELKPEPCSKCFQFEMKENVFYVSQEELIDVIGKRLLKAEDEYSRNKAETLLKYLTAQVGDTVILDRNELIRGLDNYFALEDFIFRKINRGTINIYDQKRRRIEQLVRKTTYGGGRIAGWGGYKYHLNGKIVLMREMIRWG